MAAPESALPGSITSINPTDVAQPLDAPATDLPTNADEVLPPEGTLPPDLSSTPSGGPIEVLPPASISPELPAPVTGGAAPITDVAPPVGWESENDSSINPYDYQDFLDFLRSLDNSSNLDEAAINFENEVGRLFDDDALEEASRQSALLTRALAEEKLGAAAAQNLEPINNATQFWSPKARLVFNIELSYLIAHADSAEVKQDVTLLLEGMAEIAPVARDASLAGEKFVDSDDGGLVDPNSALQTYLEYGHHSDGLGLGDYWKAEKHLDGQVSANFMNLLSDLGSTASVDYYAGTSSTLGDIARSGDEFAESSALATSMVAGAALTRWGWKGTQSYTNATEAVRTNTGTLEKVNGFTPTRQEAENLIAEAGGKVQRVERGHFEGGNPHNYPHINYTIGDSDEMITIKVQGVKRQYHAPGQKNYPQ